MRVRRRRRISLSAGRAVANARNSTGSSSSSVCLLMMLQYIEMNLSVRFLDEAAKAPTVAHPGEDIGYDLYACRDQTLTPGQVHRVHTGIAVAGEAEGKPVGFLVKDRSSMAAKGVFSHGGVIDSTYRGEIMVLMSSLGEPYEIRSGDKIAQLVPVPVLTGDVVVATELAAGGAP